MDRFLEFLVLEGDHFPAVGADDVVVMVTFRVDLLVSGRVTADVDPVSFF